MDLEKKAPADTSLADGLDNRAPKTEAQPTDVFSQLGGSSSSAASKIATEADPDLAPETDGRPEPKKTKVEQLWDPARQKSDQAHANARRDWESERSVLLANLEMSKTAAPAVEAETKPTVDGVAELQKLVAGLNGESETDDILAALKLVPDALKSARSAGEEAAIKELSTKILALETSQSESAERLALSRADSAQDKVNAEFADMLKELDAKHGAHIHEEVYARVQEELAATGHDESNPASMEVLRLRFGQAYSEIGAANPKSTATQNERGTVPRADAGTGGTALVPIMAGDLDAVLDAKMLRGDFD